MHGLEGRVPLFIELDEFHRPCVIDPDLSNEKVSVPSETMHCNGEGGKEIQLTNAPKFPL